MDWLNIINVRSIVCARLIILKNNFFILLNITGIYLYIIFHFTFGWSEIIQWKIKRIWKYIWQSIFPLINLYMNCPHIYWRSIFLFFFIIFYKKIVTNVGQAISLSHALQWTNIHIYLNADLLDKRPRYHTHTHTHTPK